ncbi:MAG: hypothetical protein M0R17_04330 [Candidatus Omnitrophica bacterium]|jgi:hypothetical protein|nr:hypothetical protein [Candidatus Omnitrophota bacterium]
MKEEILECLRLYQSENLDGIDISIKTQLRVDLVYKYLAELKEENKITKHYFGISTYYRLND